ncbi:MAG: Asp-tRNA(Asn)/Glu-tRNA(Gln) amidotransferase subunit GatB, partial [Kiritimatiellae bacterium]|nr:Asp-tRNA(Asn)/Glu-tRNA(Gln) amidotransferase subunit GatB [Kiritimatiellia bacterium]
QYDQPLCSGGEVTFELNGQPKTVHLTRIHLEEDVAKNMHFADASGVDFNRAGTPLMEIVTEPDIHSADEAMAFLQALKQILAYGGISDCNLEQGNIRCDVNCSVRASETSRLGTKTEIKNMNTFKGVHRALSYEIRRQVNDLGKGREIVQETRRWDDEAGQTFSMRSKEDAHDYRYFPEPDLLPVELEQSDVERWQAQLPEKPAARRARMAEEYGIPEYDAGVLAADRAVADFFEATVQSSGNAKASSNWIMTEMLRSLSEADLDIGSINVTPETLGQLIKLVDGKILNMPTAREVFAVMFAEGGDPDAIVKAKGLAQVSDTGAIEAMVDQIIADHAQSVEDYRGGKQAALQFLIGQVMRISKGKANPAMVRDLFLQRLG